MVAIPVCTEKDMRIVIFSCLKIDAMEYQSSSTTPLEVFEDSKRVQAAKELNLC